MNKNYAIEILEMAERRTLDKKSPLIKEAFTYLDRLKKLEQGIKERIWKIKFN